MNRISETTIQEVNDRADPLTIIGDYVRLEKRGGRYWGLCPFHNEKTPSFSVDPDRKFFYCFGCHKGGTVVSFLMEMEKIPYPEAIETLAKRFDIPVVYEGERRVSEDESRSDKTEQLAELYQRVAGSFHHILLHTEAGKKAKAYVDFRSINAEMLELFRLGYAPRDRSWLYTFLQKKGYSEEFLAESGLFSKKNPRSSFFAHRLMFPITDRQGRTVAFGGRILEGEGPKYLNSSESPLYKKRETLFAIDLAMGEIRKTKEVYLCEGYMDVIALHQAGLTNAVAPLGTAFTEEQARLLRRWAERVLLVFDRDSAGQQATVKGILTCRAAGLECAVVNLTAGLLHLGVEGGTRDKGEADTPPELKDPADILKYAGPEALQKGAKCFINDFEYLVDRGRALFDITSSEGKAHGVAFLFPYLETLESEVSRDSCVGAIADAFGVDRTAVRKDFEKRREPRKSTTSSNETIEKREVRMNDELFLMMAAVTNPSLYPTVRAELSIEEVQDPRAKELFIALEESFREDSLGMDSLLSRIEDGDLRAFILQHSASEAFSTQPEKLVFDGIKRIKEKRLQRRRAEIVLKLRTARNEGMGTDRQLDDLLSEKVHIDAELLRLKEDHE